MTSLLLHKCLYFVHFGLTAPPPRLGRPFWMAPKVAFKPTWEVNKFTIIPSTEVSHSNGPFVFQPGHLILTNSFSKEVINPADISTPKIWDQSDNWFKSYGQKVNFLLTES